MFLTTSIRLISTMPAQRGPAGEARLLGARFGVDGNDKPECVPSRYSQRLGTEWGAADG